MILNNVLINRTLLCDLVECDLNLAWLYSDMENTECVAKMMTQARNRLLRAPRQLTYRPKYRSEFDRTVINYNDAAERYKESGYAVDLLDRSAVSSKAKW